MRAAGSMKDIRAVNRREFVASMAVGVRRAAILVEELAMGVGTVAAGPNGAAAPSRSTAR